MKGVKRIKLSDIFQLVPKPTYIVGTTYSLSLAFFESVVFASTFRDRSRLKSCLIVCDILGYQRAFSEGAALQGAGQDYLLAAAPLADCFHPKVWLVLGDTEVVLLCGSGNLTQAGFMANAEVFEAIQITPDQPASPDLVRSIELFIGGLAGMWAKEDSRNLLCLDILAEVSQAVARMPAAAANGKSVQFLHSFAGRLIDQLPDISGPSDLFVAAPYFGNSLAGVDLLSNRFPSARLNIFPAVHDENATDLPIPELSRHYPNVAVSRLSVAPKSKSAFAHLKLYGLAGSDDKAWLYCTSANATAAAWSGGNIEAGILRPVSRSDLASYFTVDKEPLPTATVGYDGEEASNEQILRIWASDAGNRLEITASVAACPHLPLTAVTLSIRSGSSFASCSKPALFADAQFASVDWALFSDLQRRRKTALCLEIRGTSPAGSPVKATCFVENRMLLTADPIHRSAWRGALSLLSEEGTPEFADIAAIFSLVRDMFDGPFDSSQPESSNARVGREDRPPQDSAASFAVWPPEPDIREVQRRIGTTAAGRLQWFQRILQTLLRNDPTDAVSSRVSRLSTSDDGDDVGGSDPAAKEEDKRVRSDAERLWKRANKDYEYVRDGLFKLMPTAGNAPAIWPAAIFAFLSVMAAYRKVTQMAPGTDFGTDSASLCDEFFWTMLNRRKQDENFCCPKHYRYRSEHFPELADDLRKTFGVELHPDLAVVMMAIITEKQSRNPDDRSLAHRVTQVGAQKLSEDKDSCVACTRVWRQYIRDAASTSTDEDFHRAFAGLVTSAPAKA